ncbi:MAG: YkgJ family cysteine cluster protein [Desulfobulbaceae bacterium]|nr:YkgJ family cysteine cluster protein [Desulfobulbaceae bacterium]
MATGNDINLCDERIYQNADMPKRAILRLIYERYADWAAQFSAACRPACHICCTRNVTISAVEGEEILRYILEQGLERWLVERLARVGPVAPPPLTTNEFALACLEGREVADDWPKNQWPCPFLEDALCRIYPARPLACRFLLSAQICASDTAALAPAGYPGAATALCQIIEHLGQNDHWGNMLDVLPVLAARRPFQTVAHLPADRLTSRLSGQAATTRLRRAKPLPGFLMDEQEAALAAPLLTTIFHSEIDGKSVEDILNGR